METRRLISEAFPRGVAAVVTDYFEFGVRTDEEAARHGCYELCLQLATDARLGLMCYEACKGGHLEIIRAFEAIGVKCNSDGIMVMACKFGHVDIIHWAIERGANYWDGGLEHACHGGQLEAAKVMIARGANKPADYIAIACRSGNISLVRELIAAASHWYDPAARLVRATLRIEPNTCWDYGLQAACSHGYLEIARLMIDHGAIPQCGMFDACCAGHIGIVKLLIDHGATSLDYALETACVFSHPDVALLLIGRGAMDLNRALNAVCGSLWSPVDLPRKRRAAELMRVLITRGASRCGCLHSFESHAARIAAMLVARDDELVGIWRSVARFE